MSEFIKLNVDLERCLSIEKCGKCIKVCPVNIFLSNGDYPNVIEDNEDECTLCSLCTESCEVAAIIIHKLYEE